MTGSNHYDVVVIGGGQAGLAVGYYLSRIGRSFVILERANEIAPARRDSPVRALRREGDGRFQVELDHETLTADQVVVATGGFQDPRVPDFASDLATDVVQMHSTGYRAPADLPDGTIVVVGGGNT